MSHTQILALALWLISTAVWFVSVFFLWLLMDFQFLMWTLAQRDELGRIVLSLRPLIWLVITLGPPGLSFYLYQRWGRFWVTPVLGLAVVLLAVSFVFGRIDTQGTIHQSLPQAINRGDLNQARSLVLTVANRYGFSNHTQALIRAGIDVKARDDWGDTVLISITRWGESRPTDPALVKTLIQAGADVNAKNSSGDSALTYAVKFRNPAVVKLLLQAGADRKVKTQN